jgi:DNA-binding response OmpR family regulator
MTRILLVEDDEMMREIMLLYLDKKYDVSSTGSGAEAARFIKEEHFDLILLDLMLPEISGETLAQIANIKNIPVMIMTAKNSEEDILSGLKLGVIDYITKPFSPKILMMKIDNFFERAFKKEEEFRLLTTERTLTTKNEKIYLTPVETKLLDVMMKDPGIPHRRDELLREIWEDERSERIVDATVKNLRKKTRR